MFDETMGGCDVLCVMIMTEDDDYDNSDDDEHDDDITFNCTLILELPVKSTIIFRSQQRKTNYRQFRSSNYPLGQSTCT